VPEAGDEPVNTNVAGPGLSIALRLEDLVPGQYQPRTRMDEGAAMSWQSPSGTGRHHAADLVRRLTSGPNDGSNEIIAGECFAATLADSAPVLVRDVPDEAAAAMSLIENIQREDLNPLEEAQGLQRLVKELLTHELRAGRGPLTQRRQQPAAPVDLRPSKPC
jgi:ParB family chromosome partitioning protein